MNCSRSLLSLALLFTPLTASAGINDDPGEGGGGSSDTGGDTGPGTPTWSKSYSNRDSFGSSSWGAGYKVNGTLSAIPAYDTFKDKLTARLEAETYVRLDGGYYRLFAARAAGTTEAKRKTDLGFNAYIGSANVYSKSFSSTTSTHTFLNPTPLVMPATFLNKSVSLWAGVIPVSFTVKATGELRAGITGKISNVGIEANATPSGKASLYASAAIGGQYCVAGVCVGASAGVYSDVRLVEASAPATAAVWWSLVPILGGVNINYQAKADLTLKSLDGELGVFAEACLGGCIREELSLIDWNGFTATYPLAGWSGSFCLAGTCTPPPVPNQGAL